MNANLWDATPWRNQATSKKREANSAACFMLTVSLSYFLTLKMEAARSSETSLKIYQTTRYHILGDITFHIGL
jgi:hypothetical protein